MLHKTVHTKVLPLLQWTISPEYCKGVPTVRAVAVCTVLIQALLIAICSYQTYIQHTLYNIVCLYSVHMNSLHV